MKQQSGAAWRNPVSLLTVLALAGCAGMSEEQQASAIGAAVGTVVGAAVIGGVGGDGRSTRKGAVIGAGVGALGGYIWSNRMQEQKRQMEQATAGTGVNVVQTPDNRLKLEVPSDISFDVNKATIKPDFEPVLMQFASSLQNHPDTIVNIIGHTDSTGSDQINNPLSVNRAASTRNYLAARGVNPQRISIDGRGSREPIAENTTMAGRAMNRRVEIYVAEPAPASPADPGAPQQQQQQRSLAPQR
ncbi:MAG: OmpA family protein [Burkholderiaceae bacterium]